jgi:hypothetical protein
MVSTTLDPSSRQKEGEGVRENSLSSDFHSFLTNSNKVTKFAQLCPPLFVVNQFPNFEFFCTNLHKTVKLSTIDPGDDDDDPFPFFPPPPPPPADSDDTIGIENGSNEEELVEEEARSSASCTWCKSPEWRNSKSWFR